ncbi:MAG: prepilin peptidase [Bosea sp. (in: a-proteobacteria)]
MTHGWVAAAIVPVMLAVLTAQSGLAGQLTGWLMLWRRRSLLLRANESRRCATRRRPRAPGLFCDAALLIALALAVSAASVLPMDRQTTAAALGLILLMLILFDLRWLILPDRLIIPLALAGLADAALASRAVDAFAGAALCCGLLLSVHAGHRRLSGREGLGLGDVKLAGALGAWVGLAWVGPMIVAATTIGLAWHLPALLRGDKTSEQPFGPALALAAWAAWLGREAGCQPPQLWLFGF